MKLQEDFTWVMQGRPRRKQTKTSAVVTSTFWRLGRENEHHYIFSVEICSIPKTRARVEDGAENSLKECELGVEAEEKEHEEENNTPDQKADYLQ